MRLSLLIATVLAIAPSMPAHAQPTPSQTPSKALPFSISVYDRTRVDAWQWFAAPPQSNTYGYVESLVRIDVAQRTLHWDWALELAQPALLGLPQNAVSPIAAPGQLGLGGTYYVANGMNADPAAAFLKQAFLRYRFRGTDNNLRLGRFEFFDGQDTRPHDPTLQWLQANRIQQRLVGNFGFSNAQRSFDGVDGHAGTSVSDITAMAGRADQGVYNMNGNPELNVDIQYLAYTRYEFHRHFLWRAFGLGYHDGRTGILKTDNRPVAIRQADHKNIRIGTYGGDFLTAFPAGPGQLDLLAWGALQNGAWGVQDHRAGAVAVEGGYRFAKIATAPWLRAGWFLGSGDNNPADNRHNTFFQVLPTPRLYARFPFYNLMNNQDRFLQLIDNPSRKIEVLSDLHGLQLASRNDLWYSGGGAFDNKVFGYTGRPANGRSSFASVADISADWQATKPVAVNFYYAHAWGKTVIASIYPTGRDAQFGYVELVYRWGIPQKAIQK